MKKDTIAIVSMADEEDSFFIENPPNHPPSEWIYNRVNNVEDVEDVQVYELGPLLHSWCNPNCRPES